MILQTFRVCKIRLTLACNATLSATPIFFMQKSQQLIYISCWNIILWRAQQGSNLWPLAPEAVKYLLSLPAKTCHTLPNQQL